MTRTQEEMAWSDYLDNALENPEMIREFQTMTKHHYPIPPKGDIGDDAVWAWHKELRRWLRAYRTWVTTKYGWNKAPQWLVEEFHRPRGDE